MITASIGRSFVRHYNQKNNLNLSAKEFFEKFFYDLFFNHPKYLYWVSNSPFVQMGKGQKPHLLTAQERLEKLEKLHEKIEAGLIDASTAIGFPASETKEFATTSGQVTDLMIQTDPDEVYCSWIGGGLGVGVAGGQTILFDNPAIFDALFQGWQVYRDYLNDPAYEGLSGNKINSWNSQWLTHVLGKDYRPGDPLRDFTGMSTNVDGSIDIPTQSWLSVVLAIASKIQSPNMMGYVYKHGQTNSTYGFILFDLMTIKRPSELYTKLFGEFAYRRDAKIIENLYGSAYSFQRICQSGSVGTTALEPKGLKDYMEGKKKFKYDDTNSEIKITFNTYVTWLLAMLNNDKFWDETGEVADMLYRYGTYTSKEKDLSTGKSTQIDSLLKTVNKPKFITELDSIMKAADASFSDELEALAYKVHKIPVDHFLYFKTLVSLRYHKAVKKAEN
ncbi:hypothetical protein [Persicitalea sp.]|uniref:hypothetical protein n=1 Tax=Persicitalea sp. TaxID=3100273 RepID=UPI00359485DA